MVGVVAFTYVLFQSLLLPYGDALRSLLPDDEVQKHDQYDIQTVHSSAKLTMVRNPLTILDLANTSTPIGNTDNHILVKGFQHGSTPNSKGMFVKEEESPRDGYELSLNRNDDIGLESVKTVEPNDEESGGTTNRVNDSILQVDGEASFDFNLKQFVKPNDTIISGNEFEEFDKIDMDFGELEEFKDSSSQKPEDTDTTFNSSTSMLQIPASPVNASHTEYLIPNISSPVGAVNLLNNQTVSETDSKQIAKRKKMKSEMPPKSVTSFQEMNSILLRHRRSSRAMVWMLVLVLSY